MSLSIQAEARRLPHRRGSASGKGGHQKVRTITAFDYATEQEGGAEIPDILLDNSARQTGVAEQIAAEAAFRNVRVTEPKEDSYIWRPVPPPRKSVPAVASPQRNEAAAVAQMEVPATNSEDEYPPSLVRESSTATKSLASRRSFSPSRSYRVSSISSAQAPTSLPALQTKGGTDHDGLEPLREEEIDPASFDLVVPAHALGKQYTLEAQSELLFSVKHLAMIFDDPILLQRFTNFLFASRPDSVPILVYYLDALKALKAVEYANALSNSLRKIPQLDFTSEPVPATANQVLRDKADQAFATLANHDLPAYITHTYIQTVSTTIKRRIADMLPAHLREMSEGLAEVFCLTDPSRPDNPIVFASEEFHKTTQYGMNYVLGRNCRFLQGPKTNPFSVKRIREKLAAGKEHCETFLNYRRDGSPFMNLLMVAPLFDSRGVVRYHIGAQVDVSGLVKECAGLESFSRVLEREAPRTALESDVLAPADGAAELEKDAFCDLAEMFNLSELKTVRESGGNLHRTQQEDIQGTEAGANWHKPRLLIRDDATIDRRLSDPILHAPAATAVTMHMSTGGGRLSGVYEHYLLVRPYPSLRVLFASPSLRVPGMLQSSFMARVGASNKVRDALTHAFADGHGITAKVRWLPHSSAKPAMGPNPAMAAGLGNDAGRSRWIHCTPLLGSNGAVGVWMIVLVDDETDAASRPLRREAPPVERPLGPPRASLAPEDDRMSLGSFAAAHRAHDERGGRFAEQVGPSEGISS